MKNEIRMHDVMSVVFAVTVLLSCFAISAQAVDMGEIYSGETNAGNIATEGQTDSYTFYSDENRAVVIEMAASGSDLGPAMYLYRPDGTLETEVIGGSSCNRVVIREHLLEQTGTYTIVTSASGASGTSGTGGYALSLLLIPGAASSDQDPDGGDMMSGQTGSGAISPRADTDAFVFYGEENQAIVIEMVSSGSDLGPAIYLYRLDGTLEVEVIGGSKCNRVAIREHLLEQTGIYTIVTSASGSGGTSETGEYTLSLLLVPGATSSDQDPDGGAIVSGQTGSGTIYPRADTDAFVFYGEENQAVVIEMAASGCDLGPAIYLYRPDGTLETKVIGGSYANRVAIREHRLEQTGIYTIVTSESWASYTISTGDYMLSLLLIPGATSSEQDPDGGDIVSGKIGNGTIYLAGDTDAFVFYGEENQAVVIEMNASGSDLGPAIYLYRPNGTLETKVIGGMDGNCVAIEGHHLEQTGIYTIVASSSWAYNTTKTGGYGLSLIKTPSTLPPGIYNPVPASGATITDLNQSFGWDAIAGATGYDLYFGEGVITPIELIGENLATPEMPFPEMNLNKVYYWRVDAHIPGGIIPGSHWWLKTQALPIANFTYCPPQPVVDETIIFNASGSYDPDGGNITNYEWDFGDGNITNSAEPVINHCYGLVGDYIVNLTVTDEEETRRFVSETVAIMLRGDLNHDGRITPADALIALRIAASGEYDPAADVSDDNRVTSLDALMIMQVAAGISA
ncbi:MAG: hypothetical protein C5S49_08320 [Candidatus Methanogaster sp.]|nr:MAG: hypothetical protein C5S49_08320 [ANME-2 cluster archaeon]